jgi:two-component system OmpR family response regulator
MKILLVEDDGPLAAKLVRALHAQAFAVDLAINGEDAIHLGETGRYDCVVLDLGLPKIDGIGVLKHFRRLGLDFPVLILTARDGWSDKEAGFNAGADDYLTKPFLAAELGLRLRALMRRARGQKAEPLRCGPLSYDPQTGAFAIHDKALRLTAYETRILAKLIQFREAVVERDVLFDAVYEFEAEVPVGSFEVLISRLRGKIGAQMIQTVRGAGYRLTAIAP